MFALMATPPRKSKLAAVSDIDDALYTSLDHLDEQHLECRDMRHRWYVSSDFRRVSTDEEGINVRRGLSNYVERRLQCERCSTERIESYALIVGHNSWMSLRSLGAHYNYPDGFLLKGLPSGVRTSSELVRGLRFSRAEQAAAAKTSRRKQRSAG